MTTRTTRTAPRLDPTLARVLRELALSMPAQNAPDTVRRAARRAGLNPLTVSAAFTKLYGVSPDRFRTRVAPGTETIPVSIAHWSERGTNVRTQSAPRHIGHSIGLI